MFTPSVLRGGDQDGVSTRYGFGNAMTEVAGHPAHEHGGSIHGFSSDLLRVPGEDLLVVLLSNNPAQDPHGLSHQIAEVVLGESKKPTAAGPVLSAAELDAYVGVYLLPERAGLRRMVMRDGAALRYQRSGGELHTLVPVGVDAFEMADGGTSVRFERDAGRKVVAVLVDQGLGPVFRSMRTAEALPAERTVAAVDPSGYDALVGVYQLAPGFDFAITREGREGEQLFAQATGQPKLEIYPESPTRFFLKAVDAQIDFVVENGRAVSLVLHQGGQDLPAPRKP